MKYIFHGTNAKLLDKGLVSGTFFTDDLEIALKYGNDIYVFLIKGEREESIFDRDFINGHYISRFFIGNEHLIKLRVKGEE